MSEISNRGTRHGRPHSSSRGRSSIQQADDQRLAELEREEPLSIAEELDKAAERVRRVGKNIERTDKPDPNIHIAALQRMERERAVRLLL